MTVVDVVKDTEALTITLTAEFAAAPERVWQVWADPRQLEQWWGPPTWPATFVDFDFVAGGRATYFMTGPAGDKAHGWWQFTSIDAPRGLELLDGFASDSGEPDDAMPRTRMSVSLDEKDGGTRMIFVGSFGSLEEMERLTAMGMAEGLTEAAGQIDALLH